MDNRPLKRNNLIIVIILSTIFGFFAGVVGYLILNMYIPEIAFNNQFYGQIDFSDNNLRGVSIIIKDAKKVVVEQNDKVIETANSARGSLVGILKKKLEAEQVPINMLRQKNNLNSFYNKDDVLASGLIITSDGWLLTDFKPESLNYVAITHDNKIYNFDKIVKDSKTNFNFVHIAVQGLAASQFGERAEIVNGIAVIVLNWQGEIGVSSIMNSNYQKGKNLFSSDVFNSKIKLAADFRDEFKNAYVFDLAGNIIGVFDDNREIEPMHHFIAAIKSLLEKKEIARPSLGINYIDLSKVANFSKDGAGRSYDKGALINKDIEGVAVIKGSAAEIVGLKEGDIITNIEGMEVNKANSLTELIQSYGAGDNIIITYLRNGVEGQVEVTL